MKTKKIENVMSGREIFHAAITPCTWGLVGWDYAHHQRGVWFWLLLGFCVGNVVMDIALSIRRREIMRLQRETIESIEAAKPFIEFGMNQNALLRALLGIAPITMRRERSGNCRNSRAV